MLVQIRGELGSLLTGNLEERAETFVVLCGWPIPLLTPS
jgi:hypothetical protein